MTYESISDYAMVGIRASSAAAGTTIDVFAYCDADRREYSINPTTEFRVEGRRWTVKIDGDKFWRSDLSYDDEASFLASLETMEIVGPVSILSGQPRMQVANAQMLRIPELCKQKQAEVVANINSTIEKSRKKDEDLIADVVSRTGTQPMFGGENQKTLNNLVGIFQTSGIASFQGKFVWVEDGDYVVSQVMDGAVLLLSMTNPVRWPAITIITDKQVIEGQFWSAASRGPLQFVGVKSYRTAIGATRQTLIFRPI
ncbi:hypothetical protein [Pseudomonas sp. B16120]|uniref:hypothetical protein n=1 Tax=Pseudomonas sp. B16120 TaxID=3235108 RepID=UPI0037832B8C